MYVQPHLTIQIVTWNSARVVVEALRALKTVPADEAVVRIIDNDSADDSLDVVRRELPRADVVELPENRGFAAAHNRGFAMCETPLVMTHDPDVALEWEGVRRLLAAFEDEKIGAVQGMLVRSAPATTPYQLSTYEVENGVEERIDSAGIVQTLALNGRERGANEINSGQYSTASDLLAVTGACGIYRLAALQDAAYSSGEILDEDFFAYKEDVDLGWRLRLSGWKVRYEPVRQGVHSRTLGRRGVFNWGLAPAAVLRRLRSPRTRYSVRNWVWMIVKNASLKEMAWREIFVDVRLLVFVGLSLLYLPLLSVWWEIARGMPKMLDKRDQTFS